jgi:hypothetical protein
MTDHSVLEREAPNRRVRTTSDTAATNTAAAFTELICADAGLLHVEFNAIIAANFPPGDGQRHRRPPRGPRPAVVNRPRPAASRSPAATPGGLAWRSWDRARLHCSRQRSPPPG